MSWHYLEKEFYDHADDIEGVNIHYVCTPVGAIPDWENQRVTRYMPPVRPAPQLCSQTTADASSSAASSPAPVRLRKKILKLPQQIHDPQSNMLTDTYLLHYYFEIFQDGHRRYSPLYTEEVVTGTTSLPARHA
jgi:hypothetical protein